ncbi:hypothetical protein ACHAXA_005004 [Cyclostephanos tholiformis]|uniref:Acyl-coenzyme A thioesterase THEM4 n=1 Tax=Cyclostephanos tholiformis TaxID=382380 RepID=A0ABD3RYR5_9STRA
MMQSHIRQSGAAAAAAVALFSYCTAFGREGKKEENGSVGVHHLVAAALVEWRPPRRHAAISSAPLTSFYPNLAICEPIRDVESDNDDDDDDNDDNDSDVGFYYLRMNPKEVERTSLSDSHAIFGALSGTGMIERYDIYRRVLDDVAVERKPRGGSSRREVVIVNLSVGDKLNGHGGIVHGGILSLLFDEAMGWAYECLRHEDDWLDDPSSPVTAVTANLTVDFRAPFVEGSEGVIRVYHDERKGRKIYFTAKLESKDGEEMAKGSFLAIRMKYL